MSVVNVTDSVLYIGVDDEGLDLFENQYELSSGMCYNSYMILDDQVAVFDTTSPRTGTPWLANLEEALAGRLPDFLVISHMEPDHSALIGAMVERYPDLQLVGNALTFKLLDEFNPGGIPARRLLVKDGQTLSLGTHQLTFLTAPMVHWPEVMMTYESSEKLLFTADAFGKFGVREADEEWLCEARRYYFNICGKYGQQVIAALDKACSYDVERILPLHGPFFAGSDVAERVAVYRTWASYEPEERGVFIACASIHGHTLAAMEEFAARLEAEGQTVALVDITHEDIAECVEDAFRYDRTVFAACSYDTGVFMPMADLLTHLCAKGFRGRKVALVENGSWAPSAARTMRAKLEGLPDIAFIGDPVTIRGALDDTARAGLKVLADQVARG